MTIGIIAAKEIQEALRNRWVLATTLLLLALSLTLTFLGSAPTGNVGVQALDVVIVSLSSLTIFLLPLIALLISYDAIVGEVDRGTMLLLLSYPVARWQVMLGKFLGHIAVLAFATTLGYGASALALAVTGTPIEGASWLAFARMIASSILLGAAFVAIGYLVSAIVQDRGTAGGIAIGVWLLLVLLYDMAVLGFLVADQGRSLTAGILNIVLLVNPADAFRMFNLAGSAGVSALSGMAGLADSVAVSAPVLIGAILLWVVIPLAAAMAVFSRREL